MKCVNCGNELTEAMFINGMCFSCGHPTSESKAKADADAAEKEAELRLEKERQKETERQKLSDAIENHMLTTGYSFEGYSILNYIGIVSGESVIGTGLFSSI